MNLFRQHAQQNEQQGRDAMEQVAYKIISKYIVAQEMLNKIIVGGHQRNSESCMLCKIDKITKVMTKLEMQVGQLEKTYRLLFNAELPTSDITEKASMEYYPLTTSRKAAEKRGESGDMPNFSDIFKSNGNGEEVRTFNIHDKWPEDMPDGVKSMMTKIRETIKNMPNDNVDVQIIETKHRKSFYGVNPNDYKNFESFDKAVKKAQRAHIRSEIVGADMKGEDIIKENVIANVEGFVAHEHEEAEGVKPTLKRGAKKAPIKKTNT